MIITLTILFSFVFVAGIVGYWILSEPLKDLPTLNQIMYAKEQAMSKEQN